jgi:sugar fermentation stimulation protein A
MLVEHIGSGRSKGTPSRSPTVKGAYVLLFDLPTPHRSSIGRLGSFVFPCGHYAYIGSARGGLEQRVRRHFLKEKKLRWHIDYLLEEATNLKALLLPNEGDIECEIAAIVSVLPGTSVVVKGFGSSDCS